MRQALVVDSAEIDEGLDREFGYMRAAQSTVLP